MTSRSLLVAVLAAGLVSVTAFAADKETKSAKKSLKPLPAAEAVVSHGPYESGDCGVCHERNDAKNPGAIQKAADELCYDCHDEFKGKAPKKMKHPTRGNCVGCHSPHNSKKKSLLL